MACLLTILSSSQLQSAHCWCAHQATHYHQANYLPLCHTLRSSRSEA